MTTPLICDWTKGNRRDFRKKPTLWEHRVHESPLFSDERLIELIEKHPRDLADFCTMNEGSDDMASWRGGDPGDYSGEELLDAVRNGRLWINLRKTFNIHDEYTVLLNSMIGELKSLNQNFNPVRVMGGLLISSPTAGVPYHIDRSDVLLWHIRGHKRVWVYPVDEETMPEREVEEILLHEHNDDVPYNERYDAKAMVFDLQPGQAATWPLHAPHKVQNSGDMNVSITMEYSPFSTIMQNGAQITNGILRRRLGMNPKIDDQGFTNQFMRFAASRALRKMKLVKAKSAAKSGYLFKIDLEAGNSVREFDEQKGAA